MATFFDLESFSEEIQSQGCQIDGMLDGAEEIRNLMNARRATMQQQQRAETIKSKLCDKLREEKMKVPGLDKRIKALEDDDPELFNYIRKLEFVQDGIWCSKCNVIKNIGGKPTIPSQQENPTPQSHLQTLQDDYRGLEKKFERLLTHLENIHKDYHSKLQHSTEIKLQLEKELKEMCRRAYNLGVDIGIEESVVESPIEHASQNIENMDPVNHDLMPQKEDLPLRPDFDIDHLLEEKISAMSANDLLSD